MANSRFLIVGASGFLGRTLYARLGSARAIATYHKNPIGGGVYFEAGTMRLADMFLRRDHGLTHAFLLHGVAKLDECARKPAATGKLNVDSTLQMIDDLLDAGVTPIFTSSDAVFDGTRGLWTEEDPVNPILTYGQHKAAVEQYLFSKNAPWIVTRLSKVVGMDLDAHSVLGEWIQNIEAGETIRCAIDQVFSPAYIDNVVNALIGLAEKDLTGVFNVCGPRPLSRLDLLNLLVGEIRRHLAVEANIVPCSIRDFPFREPRPLNTSMSPKKLYSALGTTFDSMETICQRIARQRYGNNDDMKAPSGRTCAESGESLDRSCVRAAEAITNRHNL